MKITGYSNILICLVTACKLYVSQDIPVAKVRARISSMEGLSKNAGTYPDKADSSLCADDIRKQEKKK